MSLTIEEGEAFAIVGSNGAGKTTTVEIFERHRTRTSGRVEVLAFDPQTGGRAYRERIGLVLQAAGMDERWPGVCLASRRRGAGAAVGPRGNGADGPRRSVDGPWLIRGCSDRM